MIASEKMQRVLKILKQSLKDRGMEQAADLLESRKADRWILTAVDYLLQTKKPIVWPREGISSAPILLGNETSLVVVSPEGVQKIACRYALTEMFALIPSHKSASAGNLEINPLYPQNLQERSYHSDKMEAEKVRNNLRQFHAPLVVNTNPDAVNGPPIVDKNLFVLGGNSRAMTLKLLYQSKGERQQKSEYIASLLSRSLDFGLTMGDVLSFVEPVLIRLLDIDVKEEFFTGQRLVRLFNESLMQKMSYPQELTAVARSVSREGWIQIATTIAHTMSAEDESFSQYLQSPKAEKLIYTLRQFGVFNIRNFSVYFDQETNSLNRLGRLFVKDILLGHVFEKNRALLDNMNDSQFDLFSDLSPFLIGSSCCDFRFDLLEDLLVAIKAAEYMKDAKHEELRKGSRVMVPTYPTFPSYRSALQLNLFYQIPPEMEAATRSVRLRFLWQLFFEYGTKRRYLMRGFQRYSIRAALHLDAQSLLNVNVGGEEQPRFRVESPMQTLLWAFQAKRVNRETTAESAEFELSDQQLLENAPIYQGGSPSGSTFEVKTIRGKKHEFSYFNSYTALTHQPNPTALKADEDDKKGAYFSASEQSEGWDKSGSVGTLRLLNPSHRFMPPR